MPTEGKTYTCEDILADIQSIAETLGRAPTTTEYNERGVVSSHTAYNRTGADTWEAILEMANVDRSMMPEQHVIEATRTNVCNDLNTAAEEHGRAPTSTEYAFLGRFTASRVKEVLRVTDWKAALSVAGLETPPVPDPVIVDELEAKIEAMDESEVASWVPNAEELYADVRRIERRLGGTPIKHIYDHAGIWTAYKLQSALSLDSWSGVLEAAGVDPEAPTPKYSIAVLQREVHRVATIVGGPPSIDEFANYAEAPPEALLYKSETSDWDDALTQAQVPPKGQLQSTEPSEPESWSPPTTETLVEDLRQVADDLSRSPRRREYNNRGTWTAPILMFYLDKSRWSYVLEAAGLGSSEASSTS